MRTILSMSAESSTRLSATLRLRWPDVEVRTVTGDAKDVVRRASWADIIFLGPRENVVDLVRNLRDESDCGIVVLSNHPTDEELMEVLDAGADEYLGLSTSPTRLVSRVGALLRRVTAESGDTSVVSCGSLEVHPRSHQVQLAGHELHLTPTEFNLLLHLATAKGGTVTAKALQRLIWDSDTPLYIDSLRKCVQRLRKKISEVPNSHLDVVAVRGIGYRLGQESPKRSANKRLSLTG